MDAARVVRWEKDAPPSETEAEAWLHKEGYEVFTWNDVPGSAYPSHRHAADECIWVLRGEMRFEVAGAIFDLKPGDRLYLPAKLSHTASVPPGRGTTYLVGRKEA